MTPTVAYQLAPVLAIGAGVQFELFDLKALKAQAAPGSPFTSVLFTPLPGTAIGIGFRFRCRRRSRRHRLHSSINHDLDGNVRVGPVFSGVEAEVDTPEMVTASFRQDIAANMRLLGTVE